MSGKSQVWLRFSAFSQIEEKVGVTGGLERTITLVEWCEMILSHLFSGVLVFLCHTEEVSIILHVCEASSWRETRLYLPSHITQLPLVKLHLKWKPWCCIRPGPFSVNAPRTERKTSSLLWHWDKGLNPNAEKPKTLPLFLAKVCCTRRQSAEQTHPKGSGFQGVGHPERGSAGQTEQTRRGQNPKNTSKGHTWGICAGRFDI